MMNLILKLVGKSIAFSLLAFCILYKIAGNGGGDSSEPAESVRRNEQQPFCQSPFFCFNVKQHWGKMKGRSCREGKA